MRIGVSIHLTTERKSSGIPKIGVDPPPSGDIKYMLMLRNVLIVFFLLLATTHPSFGSVDALHSHTQDCTEQQAHSEHAHSMRGDERGQDCGTVAIGHCVSGFFAPTGVGSDLIFSESTLSFHTIHQTVIGLNLEADIPPPRF